SPSRGGMGTMVGSSSGGRLMTVRRFIARRPIGWSKLSLSRVMHHRQGTSPLRQLEQPPPLGVAYLGNVRRQLGEQHPHHGRRVGWTVHRPSPCATAYGNARLPQRRERSACTIETASCFNARQYLSPESRDTATECPRQTGLPPCTSEKYASPMWRTACAMP